MDTDRVAWILEFRKWPAIICQSDKQKRPGSILPGRRVELMFGLALLDGVDDAVVLEKDDHILVFPA